VTHAARRHDAWHTHSFSMSTTGGYTMDSGNSGPGKPSSWLYLHPHKGTHARRGAVRRDRGGRGARRLTASRRSSRSPSASANTSAAGCALHTTERGAQIAQRRCARLVTPT
jgi:hypothetical protein